MSLRRNAYLIIALTALVAIVGEWSGVEGGSRFWCLPAALLLLGLAYDRLVPLRAGFALAVRAPARWLLTRPVVVALEVSQHGRRALELELAPDAPSGVECARTVERLTVPVGAPVEVVLQAVPRRLGALVWPALRARASGPLGLAWWTQRLADPAAVRVEPDILGDEAAAAAADRTGERTSTRRGAGGEILQLRPYAPGDPLRSIDWKATARSGRMTARDFAEDQHLEIIVGIDAGRSSSVWCGDLDRLGHYVNLTARLAERATAQDDRVGVVVYGDRALASIAPARGMSGVMRIRALLTAIESQTTDSNPIHAAARIRALVRRRCLVILLTEIDDASTGGQLAGAVRLLMPKHLPFVVGLRSAKVDNFAREPSDDWLDPYRALAADENRVRQRRGVAALQAIGAAALVARPEQLETEVVAAYARFRRERRV